MKGIILAGDSGDKLYPLTRGIPKQLLPVYNKPMIFYPIEILVEMGITNILVITTSRHKSLFEACLGDGSAFNAKLQYAVQDKPNGIAEAILIGKDFIANDSVCLMTGDMIIEGDNIQKYLAKSIKAAEKSGNATVFVERKTYPEQYGKVVFDDKRKVAEIAGTLDASFYYSVASMYVFPKNVIKYAESIKPSERNRLEIMDVNKRFFEDCKLRVQILDSDCIWFDTNSIENIWLCGEFMRKKNQTK